MCKVNSICLKILVFLVSFLSFFFALNAESSCLLSKLLCLSLFLLNIVSTWVMETRFLFIVMTLGAFVSKGRWDKRWQRGPGRHCSEGWICTNSNTLAWLRGGGSQEVGVSQSSVA